MPPKKRYKLLRFLIITGVIVAVGIAIWLYLKRPHINVNDSGFKLSPTAFDEPATKRISEPLYLFDILADWKEIDRRNVPYHVVTWKGTTKDSAARTLEVYVDALPVNLEINRVLPVNGQEDRLAVFQASENCVLFSPETAKLTPEQATKQPVRAVTFQKVNFNCDVPNSLRNVVGTGSEEGHNTVSLTGIKGGKHKYFLVYTDHSAHPDEKFFPDVLRSFRAL